MNSKKVKAMRKMVRNIIKQGDVADETGVKYITNQQNRSRVLNPYSEKGIYKTFKRA